MPTDLLVGYTLIQCWHRVPGGTAKSALDLAEALVKRPNLRVVGFRPAGRPMPWPNFRSEIPLLRLGLPYRLLYDVWHHTSWASPAARAPEVDLIHATAATVPPTRGRPLAVTVHDLFPLEHPEQFTRRGVRVMTKGLHLAKERADLIIVPSQNTREACVGFGIEEERIRVVPWGARVEDVDEPTVQRVLEKYRLNGRYVLWVGTVEPRKNLPTLIDAFAKVAHHDADLVLVGPTGWNEQLRGHVESIAHRVRHLGAISNRDLSALFRGASVLAFPSLREGFGLPAAEAMSVGTPVIGSAGTAIAEVVGDTGILVDPMDASGWAEALDAVLGDEQLRRRLGAAARTRAALMSWDRAAEMTEAAYRELV